MLRISRREIDQIVRRDDAGIEEGLLEALKGLYFLHIWEQ